MANKNKQKHKNTNKNKNIQKEKHKEKTNWTKIISMGIMSFMALLLLLGMFVPYLQ